MKEAAVGDSPHVSLREIGDFGVWTLSSAKPGFGVHQLRDGNTNTYWQSDGPQPHCVNIQFPKKMSVLRLEVYCDLKLDESYTPAQISVRCGSHAHDLREVKQFAITEASGWIPLSLVDDQGEPVLTSMVQLAVLLNHQNGRDTHLRQVAIYGPQVGCLVGLKASTST
jgi:anaphase-promoting complex subunit 10